MVIDLICLGFCLLYMLFGWFSGGLIQVLKIAALIGAYFASVWLEPVLTELLGEYVSLDEAALSWAALLLAWAVLYVILSLLINTLVKTLYKASDTLSQADRVLGAAVGLSKGIIAILLIVMLFSLVKDRLYRHRPELALIIGDSVVMSTLGNSRVAEYILPADFLNLTRLAENAVDPAGRERLIEDPSVKKLLSDPTFQELAADSDFREAVEEGRLADIFYDPRVRRLLADPDMRELLLKINRQSDPGAPPQGPDSDAAQE